MTPILHVDNLYKRFGTLEVLRGIQFEVFPNEVVGLTGLSGSGKSVIAKVLAGLYPASSGSITLHGKRLPQHFTPARFGMEVIHQYPTLINGLSVANNIFLGREIYHRYLGQVLRWIDQSRMEAATIGILNTLEVEDFSLDDRISTLTNEQKQVITIARAMLPQIDLIYIDEPIFLGYNAQRKLLSLIEEWRQQGKTIIFCSTNLDHLFAVTDRILVLREGQHLDSFRTDATGREEIVASMVGYNQQELPTPAFWALDSYYRAREKADLLHKQMVLLEQDLQAQDTLNQQLLDQLAEQVKALDQANNALQDAQRRLLTEREQERKHLARELHDQVIQNLLSTNYQLEAVESQPHVSLEIQMQLSDIQNTIRELVDDIRRICGHLRPPTIDSLGLPAALHSFAREWSKRTGIEVKLHVNLNPGRLPETIELSLFRIVQEGLSNILRHAQATEVEIILEHTSPRMLMMTIADNGLGLDEDFDLTRLSGFGHYGLLGISERVGLLSGHLRIHNRSEGGLLLQVEVPHPRMDGAMGLNSLTSDLLRYS